VQIALADGRQEAVTVGALLDRTVCPRDAQAVIEVQVARDQRRVDVVAHRLGLEITAGGRHGHRGSTEDAGADDGVAVDQMRTVERMGIVVRAAVETIHVSGRDGQARIGGGAHGGPSR